MKNYFGFIDETGLLTSDPKQRFFAVGLLKIEDTANFYNQLSKHYYKIISRIEAKRKNFIKNTPDNLLKMFGLCQLYRFNNYTFLHN